MDLSRGFYLDGSLFGVFAADFVQEWGEQCWKDVGMKVGVDLHAANLKNEKVQRNL